MPGELHGENEIPALIRNIWPSMPEATFVTSLKRDQTAVLWGRDIEEAQPHLLIRELAASNPASTRRQWRGA
jgi:hypothetical protein